MSFRVNVDVTNPGQYFACCGLLELADRLWPGAEGWFEEREFCVECEGEVRPILENLCSAEAVEVLGVAHNTVPVAPIVAPLDLKFADAPILLDMWMKIVIDKGRVAGIGSPPWNLWSGQQTSKRIWSALTNVLQKQLTSRPDSDLKDLFFVRILQKGRFGFDPGPAWNPLDVGFSPNEQSMEVESCAAVELLAAVGLQRFRPFLHDDRETFDYYTWTTPKPLLSAAASASGIVKATDTLGFRAGIVSRGQYAAFRLAYAIT